MNGIVDERVIESWIPGRLVMRRARRSDYDELERFHYLRRRPAPGTWGVAIDWVWRGRRRVVAVGLLAHPTLSCGARERALAALVASGELVVASEDAMGGGGEVGTGRGRSSREMAERWRWVNRHVRRIVRVVVHPQFRSLGLAVEIVRELLELAGTRYVEAIAAMGRVHPMFEKGGMRRVEEGYYLRERPPGEAGSDER
jgi:GNAT superfamily N-acetyltransferase